MCPRGGACGCLRVPAVSFGVFDYTTDPNGCQGGLYLLTSSDYLWYTEEFISVFLSYPQVIHRVVHRTPQGSTGIYRIDLGQYGV